MSATTNPADVTAAVEHFKRRGWVMIPDDKLVYSNVANQIGAGEYFSHAIDAEKRIVMAWTFFGDVLRLIGALDRSDGDQYESEADVRGELIP